MSRVQLEAEGFTVLHAATGEAALVLALEQPLSLITLDIQLPKMDGWELLNRLTEMPALAPWIVSLMRSAPAAQAAPRSFPVWWAL